MRFAVCSVLVLGLAGLAACESAPLGPGSLSQPTTLTMPPDAGADAAPPSGGGVTLADGGASVADVVAESASSAEVSAAEPDAPDAGDAPASDANDADRAPLLSCAALAAAGEADELEDFQWMYEVGPGGSGSYGRPYDSVTLTRACLLTYEKTILPKPLPPAQPSTTRTVTVSAADCAEARGWATNARFLEVLATGDDCPFGMGNPDDVFEVDLSGATHYQRKTYLCPEPTLDAVRACVTALVTRSFR